MTPTAATAERNDAELVTQSLAGDRQAFGRIVARYQSLVCALTYSATGSRTHSEDLAQETFLTAWRKLRDLQEPSRLCGWLCGIARNLAHGDVRRLKRQPAHGAEAIDYALDVAGAEPLPTTQAVTNEEIALMWREVGRLPETYREPLILFYRDHKSVEHVAAALELTPDAVMQRLTRGRRLLQQRMLEFVETTLERTNPGPQFTLQVQAALPLLVGLGPATAAGTAVKSGGTATQAGWLGTLATVVAPLVGLFAAIGCSWATIKQSSSPRERRFTARWLLVLWTSMIGFIVALPAASHLTYTSGLHRRTDWLATAPVVAVWFAYTMLAVTLIVILLRGKAALRREMKAAGLLPPGTIPVPTLRMRIAITAGFLTALFWILIFLAWQTGDHAVSLGITVGVILLGAVPLWLGARRPPPREDEIGGRYVAFCGLVFLAILNWRLDTWLAAIYGVRLEVIHQLLPMAIIHGLSALVVLWTAALLFITSAAPEPQPK